jgi:capsular polysaccharide biosynthesis protein
MKTTFFALATQLEKLLIKKNVEHIYVGTTTCGTTNSFFVLTGIYAATAAVVISKSSNSKKYTSSVCS